MMHAYDEKYLNDAMHNLAEMFDFVSREYGMELDEFFSMFLASGLAAQFGNGVPRVVSGLSGTELAFEVFEKSGIEIEVQEARTDYQCSAEYWCGWVLAYYQWFTGRSFKEIREYISIEEIEALYVTLHEASEDKFVDIVNQRIRLKNYATRLQVLRKNAGLSQRELSEKAEVNLRTLQQYEIRAKDINKAAAGTLAAIASVLSCRVEDLLEHENCAF